MITEDTLIRYTQDVPSSMLTASEQGHYAGRNITYRYESKVVFRNSEMSLGLQLDDSVVERINQWVGQTHCLIRSDDVDFSAICSILRIFTLIYEYL